VGHGDIASVFAQGSRSDMGASSSEGKMVAVLERLAKMFGSRPENRRPSIMLGTSGRLATGIRHESKLHLARVPHTMGGGNHPPTYSFLLQWIAPSKLDCYPAKIA